jgi:hypothetical protein
VRTNYVLIDFENVRPASLEPLTDDHFKVIVFVGASQTRLAYEVAASVQQLGSRAEYVKVSGNGANALDFHIAYHIGRLAAAELSAYFHIISKDTGFDPLVQHLRSDTRRPGQDRGRDSGCESAGRRDTHRRYSRRLQQLGLYCGPSRRPAARSGRCFRTVFQEEVCCLFRALQAGHLRLLGQGHLCVTE